MKMLPFSVASAMEQYNWWFFLLRPGTKVPLTQHGVHDSTNDPEKLGALASKHPGCGWGLDAGRSDLLIVDLDGQEGVDEWWKIYATKTPQTRMSRTGSGGMHLLFRDEEGRARNTAKKLGAHIDTRGRGGYIVAPPSVHPNGVPYTWMNLLAPAVAPGWLLNQVDPPKPQRKEFPVIRFSGEMSQLAERVLREELNKLGAAGEGRRNDTLSEVSGRLLTLVRGGEMPFEIVVRSLWEGGQAIGLTKREVEATIESAVRFANSRPRGFN